MNKSARLKVLSVLLGLLMLVQALSGILHAALPRELFEHIHVPCGLLLLIVAVWHLALNWGWVKANFIGKR